MVDAARQRPTTAHDTTERLAWGANGTALDHTPAPVSGTPVLEVVVGAAFGAALGAAFGPARSNIQPRARRRPPGPGPAAPAEPAEPGEPSEPMN